MSEVLGLLKRRHWQGGGGCLEACVHEQAGWCISTAQHLGGREKDQEFKGNLSFAVNLRPAGLWGGGGERFLIRTYHSLNSVQDCFNLLLQNGELYSDSWLKETRVNY